MYIYMYLQIQTFVYIPIGQPCADSSSFHYGPAGGGYQTSNNYDCHWQNFEQVFTKSP